MKLQIIILLAAMIAGCVVNSQTTEKNLNNSKSDPVVNFNGEPDWQNLIKNSKLIITGYVEETLLVADEKILYEKKPSVNGIDPLPNVKDGVKGVLIQFRIDEIIYTKKKHVVNELVYIYVKNGYRVPTDTNIPTFINNKRYLLFLSPLEKADDEKDFTVIQPSDASKESYDFDYKSAFKIAANTNGQFQLTDSNSDIVYKVRQAVENQNR